MTAAANSPRTATAGLLQWWLRQPLWAGVALLVLLPAMAALGRTQAVPGLASSWVWPASGLALVYLWVYGKRYWPFVFAALGVSLFSATLAHPALYVINMAAGTLAPWVAIRQMGTLADQYRYSLALTLWRLLLWGVIVATVLRTGSNTLAAELLTQAPDNLWTHRLPAWIASGALGVLLTSVPVVGWLTRQRNVMHPSSGWAMSALVAMLALEALRLQADPSQHWPQAMLAMVLLQLMFSWRFGGTWGSAAVAGIAVLVGFWGWRHLPPTEMVSAVVMNWCYVTTLGLLNLAVMVVRSRWADRRDLLTQGLRGGGVVAWAFNRVSGAYHLVGDWAEVSGGAPKPHDVAALHALVHPDDLASVQAAQAKRMAPGTEGWSVIEFRLNRPGEPLRWLRETGEVALWDEHGQALKLSGTLQDVTQSRLAREALELSEQRYRTLSSVAPVGIFRSDPEGRVVYVNAEYAAMLRTTPEHCMGWGWTDRFTPGDREAGLRAWREAAEAGTFFRGEAHIQFDDGSGLWVVAQAQPELGAEGQVLSYVGSLTDITALKQQQDQIWVQAHVDALTGLPNRRLFMDRLAQDLLQAERQDQGLALLYIDLDQFKAVNDTLGHAAGDRLLVAAAQRIRDTVRASDTTARLGGDEFTVIVNGLDHAQRPDSLATKLVDVLRAPFELDGRPVHVSASIGITLFPQDGRSVGDLMKQADQAMYRAKAEGRNRFSYFTAAMQAEALGRLALTEDLRRALPAGQLHLHFQPIVALATGRTVKAEALLRWQHPQRGPVGPAEFIPLAEESGLIHPLGDWVFEQSLQAAQRLREATGALLPINVNKSPRQFVAGETDRRWPALLMAAQLPPDAVCIEITEGLLLEDRPEVLQRLNALAQAGLPFALDDFGTGYSAMAYLKKFPIQQLKIDRSFVRDIATDMSDRAIVAAMIAMAHQLGMVVVAEGVETEAQRALLVAAGCDLAQGWLFGRPMPEAELLARLQAERLPAPA